MVLLYFTTEAELFLPVLKTFLAFSSLRWINEGKRDRFRAGG